MKPRYIIKIGKEVYHSNPNGMGKENLKKIRNQIANDLGHDIYDRIHEDPRDANLARELRSLINSGTIPYIARSR